MTTEPFLRAATTAQVLAVTTTERLRRRSDARRSEDGLTTLEIVIWAVALFAAASLAAGFITSFIKSKAELIK